MSMSKSAYPVSFDSPCMSSDLVVCSNVCGSSDLIDPWTHKLTVKTYFLSFGNFRQLFIHILFMHTLIKVQLFHIIFLLR